MRIIEHAFISILFLMLFAACGGGDSAADGDASDGDSEHADSAPEQDRDEENDSEKADGDEDFNSDGDVDEDAAEFEREDDAARDDDEETGNDGGGEEDSEKQEDIDGDENCICDPADAMSCGPEYHCSEDCMRCEMDNPSDEDHIDGDLDSDAQQAEFDSDQSVNPDTDTESSDSDVAADYDVDINQSCSLDTDCPYGSFCSHETVIPHCAVDCVDDLDCVKCCIKALGLCGECPIENDTDPDSDGTQIYTCPGGHTSECPLGYYCLPNGYCDKECDAQNPCEDPYACNTHGQCVIVIVDGDL